MKKTTKPTVNIAIDGPSGAGKSTLSRKIAEKLHFLYIDTGAMYRAVGLAAVRAGLEPTDTAGIAALAPTLTVTLKPALRGGSGNRVFLNGENVTGLIRTEQVSRYASAVSAVPEVRALLLESQRQAARKQNVLMDGRDIATVVLPDAQIKIFLTASAQERARRRCDELNARGEQAEYETVLADIIARDERDSNRAVAPLRRHPDAVLLDTTGNTFEQSLAQLEAIIKERMPK